MKRPVQIGLRSRQIAPDIQNGAKVSRGVQIVRVPIECFSKVGLGAFVVESAFPRDASQGIDTWKTGVEAHSLLKIFQRPFRFSYFQPGLSREQVGIGVAARLRNMFHQSDSFTLFAGLDERRPQHIREIEIIRLGARQFLYYAQGLASIIQL